MVKKEQFRPHLAFGSLLKSLRKAQGVSMYRIEQETEQDRCNIRKVEEGKLHASDEMLRAIAPFLGLTYGRLKAKQIKCELTAEDLEEFKKEICSS
jgi:transcriptional regulator with XRE-family HTH domain